MRYPWLQVWMGLGAALLWVGCEPTSNVVLDDDKNPFIAAGKKYREARDWDGAITAFDRAIENNPRSVTAHFELGLLHEQHKQDYVSAIYHYQRVLKLRPEGYPGDNAKMLIAGCRRELVRQEALGPVARNLEQELQKLREENSQLRRQLEAKATPTTPRLAQPRPTTASSDPQLRAVHAAELRSVDTGLEPRQPPAGGPSATARVHRLKRGETLYQLSRLYGVDVNAILAANPGINPNAIPAGHPVTIPSR